MNNIDIRMLIPVLIILVVMLFGITYCASQNAGPKEERAVTAKNSSKKGRKAPANVTLPSDYHGMDLVSAGFYAADYEMTEGERSPWVTLRDAQGTIHFLRFEDGTWMATALPKAKLPENVRDITPLSAGYYASNHATIKNQRSPWIAYRLEGGVAIILRYEDGKWNTTSIR